MSNLLKNTLSLLLFVSGFSLYHSQLTDAENYVYSKTYFVPVTSSNTSAKGAETVTYFDGLGRPKQTIAIKAGKTPTNDLVTPIIYDCFGRQARDYMAIPQDISKDGGIYTQSSDCSTDGNAFPVASPTSIYASTEKIYSRKVLENSPLDRIQQQVQPGSDWQTHPLNYDYQTNNSTDVLKFTTDTRTRNGAFYTYELKVDGFYAASKLYKNKVSDEDGKTTYEFKNGEGQVLLVRKVIGGVSVAEPADMGVSLAPQPAGQFVDTYYVYNEYNQLAFVISPLASADFRANSVQTISDPQNGANAIISNLCYQYNYDGQNRLVEKKLPGKGWEYLVYDKADRLIMTQDSEMRRPENGAKWMITKYDKFGRVAYTGFIPGGSRESMQNQAGGAVITEERNSTGFNMSGSRIYYTNTLFVDINTVLSVNYYDTYPTGTPLPTDNKIQNEPILLAAYDGLGRSTKSLPLATMTKNINDDKWTKNYSYYDNKGRMIGTTSINHLNGRTRVEMKLDFAGVVKHSETWHNKVPLESPIHIIEDFFYDHQNRLQKHYHEVEGKTSKELLADNTYDELGRLDTKKVGARSDASFNEVLPPLQSIKYNYNIRGWMTGINLNNEGKLDIGKLFSYKIKYNDPANTTIKKYNGNISEIDWTYAANNFNRYEYTYDDLNRLRKGNYKTFNETTTTDSKYFNEELTYDINGNIKTLKRNARPRTGTTFNPVDNLIYYYENNELSNRLQRITDNEGGVANVSGYPGGGGINTYDSNGNMLTMPDKNITQNITYNYLNLPQVIVKNNQPVTYTYRADGTKVHKSFEVNGQNIETWYLDGFVYTTPYTPDIVIALQETPAAEEMSVAGQRESFELADKAIVDPGGPGGPIGAMESAPNFFSTAEGFYDFDNFRYIYQYKDYLGNTRLNYGRDENNDLFTEDSNDYYPFGLNFINPPAKGSAQLFNPSATYKNYKYNGKELQETGMYDYGARMYMADIGRWGVVDPLAEKSRRWSTYTYVADNPMKFIDPDGRFQIDPKEFNKTADAKNKMALNEFAHTKTGYDLLSRFAKAGDVVGGVKFTKDGDLHKAGVDLKLDTNVTVMSASGTTDSKIENGRLVNKISIGNGNEFIGNGIESMGHEISIHALPKSLDFADDKKLNLSSGYFAKPTKFLQSLGYTAENNDDYYGIFEHYQEKVTRNARNTYISPILNQYYNSINKDVQQKDINNAIDGFSLVSDDTRIKY